MTQKRDPSKERIHLQLMIDRCDSPQVYDDLIQLKVGQARTRRARHLLRCGAETLVRPGRAVVSDKQSTMPGSDAGDKEAVPVAQELGSLDFTAELLFEADRLSKLSQTVPSSGST